MVEYKTPGQHLYDGILLPGHFTAKVYDRIRYEFKFDKDDLLIATFPKSGQLQMVLCQCTEQINLFFQVA